MSQRTALVRRLSRGLSGELQGELQSERGYLMVALLVALSVMAIMMGAALPAWHTMAQREKEAELIFRGEQYARAIGLWQRRFANAAPPSIDVLVEQRFLRKKYKDPITNGEFQLVGAGGALPGQTQSPLTGQAQSGQAQQGQSAPQQAAGRATAAARQVNVTQGRGGDNGNGNGLVGGIAGVTSKSAEKSLRLYNSRDTYNQWIFMPVAQTARAGGAGGAGGASGAGAGGRGGGRDGRGADGRGVLDGRGRGPQGDGGRGGFDGRGRGPQGDGGRGAGGRGGQQGAPAPRGRF